MHTVALRLIVSSSNKSQSQQPVVSSGCQSKCSSSEYLSLAKAGNLDIEQLDQCGSVKLHLIKRVTLKYKAIALALMCIANKQPGFKKRDWSLKYKAPLLHCSASNTLVQAGGSAPGSHLLLSAVASLLSRCKWREKGSFCYIGSLAQMSYFASQYCRSYWATSKDL